MRPHVGVQPPPKAVALEQRAKFHELWANHGSRVGEQALKFFGERYDVEREVRARLMQMSASVSGNYAQGPWSMTGRFPKFRNPNSLAKSRRSMLQR